MTQLNVENVSATVDNKKLIQNMSFSIDRGKVLALVGHNGAGKSTLMKTIIGMIDKSDGKISILETYNQDKSLLSFKKHIAYLPEEPLLLTELTVMQHFQLYGMSYDIEESVLNEQIDRYVKGFDLTTKLQEYPESLSKGMRQKAQAICALLPRVPVLLIDEPFIGLDIYAVEFLISVMREKIEQGTSILLTTHQLDMLADLADDFILLRHGKIESYGPIETFESIKRGYKRDD